MLNNQEFLRYSKHLLINEIGIFGQKKIKKSTILIVGLGGLGSLTSIYLTAAGIGTIILADYDNIDLSNLQRQILYKTKHIGQKKVDIALKELNKLNSNCTFIPIYKKIKNLNNIKQKINLILDCSDNMKTRFNINKECVINNIPLISASSEYFNGQLFVFTPPWKNGCYECIFPDKKTVSKNCQNAGIISPIIGIMASFQVLETIKLICNINLYNKSKIQLFYGKENKWFYINSTKNNKCKICKNK